MKPKMTVLGTIGRIEMKHTKAGDMFMIVSVACNSWNSKKGEQDTTWVECLFFKKSAEYMEKFALKGQPIFCEGEPTVSAWQNKDGEMKTKLGCMVHESQLLGERKASAAKGSKEVIDNVNNKNVNNPSKQLDEALSTENDFFTEEDIPF